MKNKDENKKRRICVMCDKVRYIENMVKVGSISGRYFQKGKEVDCYACIGCDTTQLENINRRLSYRMQRIK